ncbi:IQ domain-containing protein/DUF4005 domain-containing protein [Cephalotus follicularis]|uniref:IQ domain-containing protein/DUF4005 domain-containing protein n=1 Tax=Cephalotus follicularis TaxID=3775 RepID=A0A1Q3BX42_CEPFO|nr:IQ domain-containing protein/DUF4005 domain-containing protein [Cephalotus follicularis]
MGLFRRLFGAKKNRRRQKQPEVNLEPAKDKRRWSLIRSSKAASSLSNKHDSNSLYGDSLDANKHAIAVAAATAAVAEAALAAAQAAAEVVRLTSCGSASVRGATANQVFAGGTRYQLAEVEAAIKIQCAFKGYLARRALRALKALVKLQALVRGHIVRKQTTDMLRRMQTLVRLQARARASRSHVSESFHSVNKSYNFRNAAFANPINDGQQLRAYSTKFDGTSILKRCGSNSNLRDIIDLDKARTNSNWFDSWMEENQWDNNRDTSMRHRHADDERNDKILEVDTWKPHFNSQQNNRTFRVSQHVLASDYNSQSYMLLDSPSKLSARVLDPIPSVSSGEVLSLSSLKFPVRKDEAACTSADNGPQLFSASSRPGSSGGRCPFTPARSECAFGYYNGYSGHPNYMANTESSRAKVRSQSVPRQRLDFDRYGSARRSGVQGVLDASTISERTFAQYAEFRNKGYPASGRLDRLESARLR